MSKILNMFLRIITGITPYLITIALTVLSIDMIDSPMILAHSHHLLLLLIIAFSVFNFVTLIRYKRTLKKCKLDYNFYEGILDALPFPVFYKDLRGIYRYCNKYFETNLKVDRKTILGKHTKDVYENLLSDSEIQDSIYSDIRLLRGEPIVVDSRTFIFENKTHKYITFKQLHKDPNNKISGIVGAGYNPDELKEILKRLDE